MLTETILNSVTEIPIPDTEIAQASAELTNFAIHNLPAINEVSNYLAQHSGDPLLTRLIQSASDWAQHFIQHYEDIGVDPHVLVGVGGVCIIGLGSAVLLARNGQ